MKRVAKLAVVAMAATALFPTPAAKAQCLLEVSAAEAGLHDQINQFREKKRRGTLTLDEALHDAASLYVEVMSNEGEGSTRKLRMQTRNQVAEELVAVGALTMKGGTLKPIWRRMTKNTYPKSILLRRHYMHIGIGMKESGGKTYVVVLFGGNTVTPLAC